MPCTLFDVVNKKPNCHEYLTFVTFAGENFSKLAEKNGKNTTKIALPS